MAATESCFDLVRPHQRDIAVGQKKGLKALCTTLPFSPEAGPKHPFKHQLHVLMRPNKAGTAVHGCHYLSDMAVRMWKVLARPWVGFQVCHLLLLLFFVVVFFFLLLKIYAVS